MQNWSSSVDTSSSSVDTRDRFQKTFWPTWDSVLTLDQVVSTLERAPRTFWVNLGQCVDTGSGSVDTRDLLRTPSGRFWDSVSTLVQVVSTQPILVSTPCFEHKAKTCKTGQLVSTLVQVVSTLETGSVDTGDFSRTPSGLFWDSVSTLAQVVSTLVPFQRKTYRSRVT
ncbi:hypothetical protein Taro_000106 [Colocasia esculenta]|uniref:Uncharacterized protein n=1 Tax=Colocasia esculenta TaxID=4460 RepID=A0A843TGM6_COLES|nr:hypothetical protein [Colocasia esculenta]